MHQNIALSMVVTFRAKKIGICLFSTIYVGFEGKNYIKNQQNAGFSRKKIR